MTTNDERVEKIRGWLAGRLPQDWFEGPLEVTVDRDEITVVGRLAAPTWPTAHPTRSAPLPCQGRIKQFREETRERRIEIARELEHRSRPQGRVGSRRVATGASCSRRSPCRS